MLQEIFLKSAKLSLLVFDSRIAFSADARQIPLGDFRGQDLHKYLRYRIVDCLVTKGVQWRKLYASIAENAEPHGLIMERQLGSPGKSRPIVFKIKQREGDGSAG